jgi:hypothetical protein
MTMFVSNEEVKQRKTDSNANAPVSMYLWSLMWYIFHNILCSEIYLIEFVCDRKWVLQKNRLSLTPVV